MSRSRRAHKRLSMNSDSSDSSSPERDDDGDSIMQHANDSQSSIGVSLEDMDLDRAEYEERCRLSPITRLPAELLIAVLYQVHKTSQEPAKDLRNCMLVSKAWARNSVDLLWHRPSTGTWKVLLAVLATIRKGECYFAYHDLVKRLNLATLGDQISDGTVLPFMKCKRIERLTLTNCTKLTDWSVGQLVDGNRSLLAIDASGLDNLTDSTLLAIAYNCYKLQGLNVTKCSQISDESLVAIAQSCRRLKRVKLNECSRITDRSILAFADHCREILEIDLHGCYEVNDWSITALMMECRQLRELRLAMCTRISDEAFLRLPQEAHFEYLRILDLTDCNDLQDAGLQKIISAAPRLRNLVLAKCRNISDRGVFAITKLGKNLHYIHLGHCSRITDHGVNQLIRYCNRIRYIDLACCQNLTDDSVTLLSILPKLKRIGLVKCGSITDASIIALATPKGSTGHHFQHNLERLHLSYCANLTIRGIRTMLIACPNLTHLSLTGVHEFLREDLLQYCREAPSEFNDHQRDVFCVFSGKGVENLRAHLRRNYPSPPQSEADSDDAATLDGFPNQQPATLFPPQHHQGNNHVLFNLPPAPPPHATHTPLAPAGVQVVTPAPLTATPGSAIDPSHVVNVPSRETDEDLTEDSEATGNDF